MTNSTLRKELNAILAKLGGFQCHGKKYLLNYKLLTYDS